MGMGKWWSLDWYHIFGQTQAIQDCHLAVGHGSWTWQGPRCARSKGCVGNGDVLATESWKSVSFNLQYHGSKFLETSCHLELHFMLRAISYIVYIHWLTIIYAKPLNLIWVGRTQRRSVFMQSNCTVQNAKQCSTTKQANIIHALCLPWAMCSASSCRSNYFATRPCATTPDGLWPSARGRRIRLSAEPTAHTRGPLQLQIGASTESDVRFNRSFCWQQSKKQPKYWIQTMQKQMHIINYNHDKPWS